MGGGNITPLSPPLTNESVRSSHRLLPKVQSPPSPVFGTSGRSNNLNRTTGLLSIIPSSSSGGYAEGGNVPGGSISYSPPAFGVNVASSPTSTLYTTTLTASRNYVVEPFVLQAAPSSRERRRTSKGIGSRLPVPPSQAREPHSPAPSSQSVNLHSPSTPAAIIAPFILPPPPCGAMIQPVTNFKEGSSYLAHQMFDTPAPPYTFHDSGEATLTHLSPIVVEYSPTSPPSRSSGVFVKADKGNNFTLANRDSFRNVEVIV